MFTLEFLAHLAPLHEHAVAAKNIAATIEQTNTDQTSYESQTDGLITGAALVGVFALVAYATKPKHTYTKEVHQDTSLSYAGRKSIEA